MAIVYSPFDRPAKADKNEHSTGRSPSMSVLGNARKSALCAATYQQHGLIYIGDGGTNTTDNTFEVFYPFTTPIDSARITTRKLQIVITTYQSTLNSTPATVSVDFNDGVAPISKTWTISDSEDTDFATLPFPNGPRLSMAVDAPTSGTGIIGTCGRASITVSGIWAAQCYVWSLPDPTPSVISQFGIGVGAFVVGDPLRGYDTTGPNCNYSVDSLIQNQNSRVPSVYATVDTFTSSSRRVLWQYGNGCGIWCQGSGAAGYLDVMSNRYKPLLTKRNMTFQTTEDYVEVHIAYRGDKDTKLKIETLSAGDSEEMTVGSTTSTTAVYSMAINASPYDTLAITAYVSSSIAFEIKGIAVVELGYGTKF